MAQALHGLQAFTGIGLPQVSEGRGLGVLDQTASGFMLLALKRSLHQNPMEQIYVSYDIICSCKPGPLNREA